MDTNEAKDRMVVIFERPAYGRDRLDGSRKEAVPRGGIGLLRKRGDGAIKLHVSGCGPVRHADLLYAASPGGGRIWGCVRPLRLSDLPTAEAYRNEAPLPWSLLPPDSRHRYRRFDIALGGDREGEWPFPFMMPRDASFDERALMLVIGGLEKRGWKWRGTANRRRSPFAVLLLQDDGMMDLGEERGRICVHARQLVEEETKAKELLERQEREAAAGEKVLRAVSEAREEGEVRPGEELWENTVYRITRIGPIREVRADDLVIWAGEMQECIVGERDVSRVEVLRPAHAPSASFALFVEGEIEGLVPVMTKCEWELRQSLRRLSDLPPDPLAGLTLREQSRIAPYLEPLYEAAVCPKCWKKGCMCPR